MQMTEQVKPTGIATCPLAMSNRAFYEHAVKTELVAGVFEATVFRSRSDPAARPFTHGGYDWQLTIEASELFDTDERSFLENFQHEVNQLAARLPMSIMGEMSERAVVQTLGYKFEFRITGYWDAGADAIRIVEDPEELRPCVNYGRHVELQITYAI
jgi:hypothetical protein